ncbi:hypothetical protein GQ651_08905 [Alphaproteobacteria bacterium GH1-50]|uniref:Uncharacterized protein n=1 Tax=Kangsaoukella pontilimi TaxID=2691042 RepID=A0A7C9IQQ0_9RHOB|nr:hypothetical protein [Kangsaoukella pontilimi]MXQ07963.1 hypothetical protein [Kangsaoukella pontilimi]
MTALYAASGFRSETFAYITYVVSTCRLMTPRAWRRAGRPAPFAKRDYRADIVTRTQIVDLFFADS